MKKLTFVMTLMLAVLLASCSKNQSGRLIPDTAFAVLRLDVMKTMESTGMKGDDTSVKSQVEMLIKRAGLDKEVREKLLEIVDDPTSSGIDFTEPIYVYFTVGGRDGIQAGVVGTTASKGNLADVINMLGEMDDDISLEEYESNGVQYARLDRSTLLAFNGDWFYFGPVDRHGDWDSQAESTIEDLLDRADGNNNMEGNEAFKKMNDGKGLMQIAIFGSGFDGLPGTSEMMAQIPEGCELSDIAGITDIIINKGEIVAESEALLMSDAWKEQVEKYGLESIEKSMAKYADADGALAIVNIDPKNIFRYVKRLAESSGASRSDMEELNGLKPIFDALTGKAMVAVNNWYRNDGPEIAAYVGTKNNSLVEQIVGDSLNMEERGLQFVGDNEYRIPIDYDYDYNDSIGDWTMTPTKFMQMGWKDKQTYFLMNTDDEPFTTPRNTFTDVKGVGFYARAAGKLLGDAVSSIDDDMEKAGLAVADIVDYMELYFESPTKGIFRIATNKKDKSPIVTVIDYVKKHFL